MSGDERDRLRSDRDAAVVRRVLGPLAAGLHTTAEAEDEAADMEEFYRQQAVFMNYKRGVDQRNWPLAVPAFAPYALLLALEGGAALGARLAAPAVRRAPLNLARRYRQRGGETPEARAGRLAHKLLEERLSKKPGWKYEPRFVTRDGKLLKPDVGAPQRHLPESKKRFLLDLKPNTPSGIRRGARSKKIYEEGTGNRTRPIYYDPEDMM